jgi:hypothetical protein
MNHSMESAFADEVLAELGAQRSQGLTAKEVQRRAGITNSTWGNYFVQRTTRIPLSAMLAVSDALGVLPEEMIRRARVRAEGRAPSIEDRLAAMLSPEALAVVREEQARLDRERTDREGKFEDPPNESSGRPRRSA